jgi:hypothetical protein
MFKGTRTPASPQKKSTGFTARGLSDMAVENASTMNNI